MLKFIQNTGDYFSTNYFDEDFAKKVHAKSGYSAEALKGLQKQINGLKDRYFRLKQLFLEGRLRTKDKVTETHRFHTHVLNALGYPGDHTEYDTLFPLDEKSVLPVRHTLHRGTRPHLMIMEMHALIKEGELEPDGLFEQQYNSETDGKEPNDPQAAEPAKSRKAGKYHRSQWRNVYSVPDGVQVSPMVVNKAVSELFLLDQHRRPRYILLCAGNMYYLLEQEKWFRGSYLQINLEELFSEATVRREYYSLAYCLLAKDTLAPASEMVLMEQLDEDSHKSAYEVTKDLKEGVINAVEALANEALRYLADSREPTTNYELNAEALKNDCLTYVYRLLFLFYAESREDLDILPANDPVYQHGYSIEMLRDLEQTPLSTATNQNGFFFHDSLQQLFGLLHTGYAENDQFNPGFKVRQLDSPLFDDSKLAILPRVAIRNIVWQDVICQLSLSRKQKGKARGRISYANLGINQLGSVYESLLAFRGFFAETDYIEVHRKRKSKESSAQVVAKDGSYLVPRHRFDAFEPDEIYHEPNKALRVIDQGTFIYRLSGRDRQKSASYYTPEVLTQCTVKYTLKPLLERLDKGELKALDLLDMKVLEPAMGAAAFHNEAINQLAAAYLSRRQLELKRKVDPDQYQKELQKIKAYIALNNVYGVDLNPTAVELGKLSLWLNVIHKDMPTPFFGYRLGVGNAVVGGWLKVYHKSEFLFDPKNKKAKKEWWTTRPRHVRIQLTKAEMEEKATQRQVAYQPLNVAEPRHQRRRVDEVYHFLLPDKGMVSSANIKLLKNDLNTQADEARKAGEINTISEIARVSEWRKEFVAPVTADEFERLGFICQAIDELLDEHYDFQWLINRETQIKTHIFGGYGADEQTKVHLKSYLEKEKLAERRNETNAPYYKLKMVMDYWCSLWFWDVREAAELPSRKDWYDDLEKILHIDFAASQAPKDETPQETPDTQTSLFATQPGEQPSLQKRAGNRGNKEKKTVLRSIAEALKKQPNSLFSNRRSEIVLRLASQYSFFHYQLEFIEVFKERGGFDMAVGNPPWLKLEFEEKGLMAETFPELLIRKVSGPEVRKQQKEFLAIESQQKAYYAEAIEHEASTSFMNAYQNYPLLKKQQTNLYKCVIENGFHWISEQGYLGLVHPEGIYNDPKGQPLREEIYQRLKYHFQFLNVLNLFAEVGHKRTYGIHIYAGKSEGFSFFSINNLFHPSTIDGCFMHNGLGKLEGMKTKNQTTGSFTWNIKPHKSRAVYFTKNNLKILAKTFENDSLWQSTKLVSIHAQEILNVLEKLGKVINNVKDYETKITECWDETNDRNKGNITRQTKYPEVDQYEMIYSGPHIFVATPLYKTPRRVCTEKGHYDIIDPQESDENYMARTNYIPLQISENYNSTLKGFFIEKGEDDKPIYDNWLDYYKLGFRAMLDASSERTLMGAILPPKTAHIHGVKSIAFKDEPKLIELAAITSSIVLDFLIKTMGKAGLYDNAQFYNMPLGFDKEIVTQLSVRVLLLNCLNKYYAPLWERNWQPAFAEQQWSRNDARLKPFDSLTATWEWATPLRNWFERRQALVEIDVITAKALGLTLDELVLIYNVQFPVLQQNEDDTWYDTRGNIVFTCSKGLTGVGLDRPDWESIKDLPAGETYTHTIRKSELYQGKEVVYHAPFRKCDRAEDYRVAWDALTF